jgi:hypothetical protein
MVVTFFTSSGFTPSGRRTGAAHPEREHSDYESELLTRVVSAKLRELCQKLRRLRALGDTRRS